MTIPDFQTIMLPLLKLTYDEKEYELKQAVEYLSNYFKLANEEKNKKYPNRNLIIFYDRTHWALTYLKHAGLLIGTKRGYFKITERGKKILNQNIEKIDNKYLKQFSEFKYFTRIERKENK